MWIPADERQKTGHWNEELRRAAIEGLASSPKSLPCRFFYDARGSRLFEQITALAEYYVTRAETAILVGHAREMVEDVPPGGVLVEFGSGSSRKTEILLAALPDLAAYVPIDVSPSALEDAQQRITDRFPKLSVRPVVGNFMTDLALPDDLAQRPRVGFFPGSTIGNLARSAAQQWLAQVRDTWPADGRLIIGVDLKKDAETLVAAYDDARGVTAAFNLNLLARLNREAGADFDLKAFRHEARYAADKGRIEMHLVSLCNQAVRVGGHCFQLRAGESIHTENAYKYTLPEFRRLARAAGWQPRQAWTDPGALFSVHELVPARA